MVQLSNNITDPVYSKPDRYSVLDRLILRCLRDVRDLPFTYFILKIIFLLIPFAVLLFLPVLTGWHWLLAAIIYIKFNVFFFIGRFALMFHCVAHRVLFNKAYNYLNYLLPWFIAPFFGHMADTYHAHHVGMHHAENNLKEDDSTTMPYQRDSIGAFFRYLIRFLTSGIYNLAIYFKSKNRKKLMRAAVQGEVAFIIFCLVLSLINLPATLCVFVFPYFFYRLIAMMGNWAQHAFIDAQQPGDPYKNSVTCINSQYNWQCWNDGYHISHHLKPTMHWTEHPIYFQDTICDK